MLVMDLLNIPKKKQVSQTIYKKKETKFLHK